MKTRNHTVTAIIAAFVLAATGSTSLAATGNGTSSEAGRAALAVAFSVVALALHRAQNTLVDLLQVGLALAQVLVLHLIELAGNDV